MTPQQLNAALRQLHADCPAISGTVLATSDGLILAATDCLDNETAAATAVHLTEVTQQHLGLILASSCTDLLVWSEEVLWYVLRLPGQQVLMLSASADCPPGMLRLVARDAAERLDVDG